MTTLRSLFHPGLASRFRSRERTAAATATDTLTMAAPNLNPYIFRAYDIRGAVDEDLTPGSVERIGRAYGSHMRREYDVERVVIGRDNRPSSESLSSALSEGIRAAGVSVVDIGLAPSPLVYYAAATWGIDGGAVVTASHSPTQMNGLKLLERRGIPISPDEIQRVYRIAVSGDFTDGAGTLEPRDAKGEYLEFLARRFALRRPLCVAVDPGNAVATVTGPEALRRIGCEVSGINLELDGTFPAHLPDPQDAATMEGLRAEVRRVNADMGVAWDGDGDRVGIVDELGGRRDADALLVVFARDLLSRHPGARILLDVKVSLTTISAIRAAGGKPVLGPCGHSLGKRKLRDEGILFGGETAAHFYFAENYFGLDDGVYASCVVAKLLSEGDRPLSQFFAGIPQYVTSPEFKLPCPDDAKFAVVAAITERFRAAYPVLDIDGARIDFGEGWALVRASNTGPALTARIEAESVARYEEIRDRVLEALATHPTVTIPDEMRALPS